MTATVRPREGHRSIAQDVHGLNHGAHDYRVPNQAQPGSLPPDAAAQLRDMEATAQDLNAAANATFDRLQHEREDRALLQNSIAQMERAHPDQVEGDKEYERAKKSVAAQTARIAETSARYERQSAAWNAAARLVRSITEWHEAHADAPIVPLKQSSPRTGKGETALGAVERCRSRLAELRAEADRIEAAPLPSADAKAAVRAYVEALASRGRPDVRGMLSAASGKPHFANLPGVPVPSLEFGTLAPVALGGVVNDGLALLAWTQPDLLIASLDAEIDTLADDARAMTAVAQAVARAEVARQILAVERDEEAFLRMSVATGFLLDRRADADPRAVLMVTIAGEAAQ
ncbi:hypothetical protein [Methylobacterium sp. WL120]|uniref:hypothetical protein n=1 Tax=Methylobacterium sp. WL120 TaxID=2603887 RepID=UPI0011C9BF91|nr:hypothetical protein [Methylobacterium sp. WL120]TXM65786.1 hypothetical protein FV229_14495 [Methylobacterium sp. WL120]